VNGLGVTTDIRSSQGLVRTRRYYRIHKVDTSSIEPEAKFALKSGSGAGARGEAPRQPESHYGEATLAGMETARTKADEIAGVLEEAILSGELSPGEVLRQEQLSDDFGVRGRQSEKPSVSWRRSASSH
jgi:hypothetical protein